MNRQIFPIIISFLFITTNLFADTWTSALISTNTTWLKNNTSGDGIYIVDNISDSLVVETGVTLTIEPGVTVKFNDDIQLLIYGTLNAQGTVNDSIVFTIDDAPGSTAEWGGIKLLSNGTANKISYSRIEFGNADIFTGNSPVFSRAGGAIFCAETITSNTEIKHNLIWKNTAFEGGGGIFCDGARPVIENNVIRDNSAGQYGGGIAARGTVSSMAAPRITTNLIINNSADQVGGGGIGLVGSTNVTAFNNLIYNNSSLSGAGGGIILYFSDNTLVLRNSILWGNSASTDDQISGIANVENSNIEGSYNGTGNIDVDPGFTNAGNYDFHFEATSPLVDAGIDTDAPLTDFDGNTRPFDGDRNGQPTTDIGPYEYINTVPVITSIPITSIDEEQSYSYTVTANDPDAEEELTFTLLDAPSFLDINSSSGEIFGTPTTDSDAGARNVSVQVSDRNNAKDQQEFILNVTAVNDAPIVDDISNQTIEEGASFLTITLDNFISDEETAEDQFSWTYSGNIDLNVSIDPNRIANITAPNLDWFGIETITFTAEDEGGLTASDAAIFTITNINDAPVVSIIQDQQISEGQNFTPIVLDDFVEDVDNSDDQLSWTTSDNSNLDVSIDQYRVATISALDENWNGDQTLTFRVEDPAGLADSVDVLFTVTPVNDPPIVADIPDQSIDEGSFFLEINLDDYVTDIDNNIDDISWTSSGSQELTVTISASRVATIEIPNLDWVGTETITFVAKDLEGLQSQDAATFVVNNINDQPIAVNDTVIANEDVELIVQVLANDTDIDNDQLQVESVSNPVNGTAQIQNGTTVRYISDLNYFGQDSFSYTIVDGNGGSAIATVLLTVEPINDPPEVIDISDQSIQEGENFNSFDLDDFVSDVDNSDAEMNWSFSGNSELTFSIDANNIVSVNVINPDWNGSEAITFEAADPAGLKDQDVVTFSVIGVNDPPVVSQIENQTVAEGTSFAVIVLDNFVEDIDNSTAEISWAFSGNTELSIQIDANRIASVTPVNENWNGSETIQFKATDPGGLADSTSMIFTWTPVNDAPVITQIPGQTIDEGMEFSNFDLDDFVSDVDNSDAEMNWSFSGNSELTFSIDANNIVSVNVINPDWNGSEAITFEAADPAGLKDQDVVTFSVIGVNDPPVVSQIENQTVAEGTSFAVIVLDNFVEDIDNSTAEISWAFSGNTELSIQIDANRIASVTPVNENWNGSETIQFKATDPGGLADSTSMIFTWTPVNDAPVITQIPGQTIDEGMEFSNFDLDDFVSDVDNTNNELIWNVTGQIEFVIDVNTNNVVTIAIPSVEWNGSESIQFKVADQQGLSDSINAIFTVSAVNDKPVFTGILPDVSFNEDDSLFYSISNWYEYVEDIDNPDTALTFTVIEDIINAQIRGDAYLFKGPPNWFDKDTLLLVVSDGEFNDTTYFPIIVYPINDPPVISGLPESVAFNNDTTSILDFRNLATDIDSPIESLLWSFAVNRDSVKFDFDTQTYTLTLSAPGFSGDAILVCTVTDDSLASVTDTILISVQFPTALDDYLSEGIPTKFELSQNFPNPFNPETTIKFALPKASRVQISVFNIVGQKVATLFDSQKPAGYHSIKFNSSNLSSGLYFYQINTQGFQSIKKMVVVK